MIGVGIAGLGVAGRAFIPALREHPGLELVAVADLDADARAAVSAEGNVPAFADLDTLLAHPGVEAVCIATPTAAHRDNVIAALEAGKHVVVEKPMAIAVADAEAMVEAADRADRVLLVGHSHSYDRPIRAMRAIIRSGDLGRVRIITTTNYTDWVYRPRRPDELLTAQGGGVTFRQGAHQIDILRLLGGGLVTTVRARTFDWDPARPVIGAHQAVLDFADGTVATAFYNGYGGLPGAELCGGVGEWGFAEPRKGGKPPMPADIAEAKRVRALSGERNGAPDQPHFGVTIASCERGDIRQSAGGLTVYTRDATREVPLETGRSPYNFVVAEFFDAIDGRRPPIHDGRWGLANLEVCAAIIRSAQRDETIVLERQVAARDQ